MNYRLVVHLNESISTRTIDYIKSFAQHNCVQFSFVNNRRVGYVNLSFRGSSIEQMKQLWKSIQLEADKKGSLIGYFKKRWIVMLCKNEDWDSYILLKNVYEKKNSKVIAHTFLSDRFSWEEHLNNLPKRALNHRKQL